MQNDVSCPILHSRCAGDACIAPTGWVMFGGGEWCRMGGRREERESGIEYYNADNPEMKRKLRQLIVVILLGGGAVFCIKYAPEIKSLYDFLTYDSRDYTRPLDKETQKYLCDVFDISDEKKCKPKVEVYTWEFRYDLIDYIKAGNLHTNDEWDRLFGQYKDGCKYSELYVMDNGTTYYKCFYDFTGDGVARVRVLFTEDGDYIRLLYISAGS